MAKAETLVRLSELAAACLTVVEADSTVAVVAAGIGVANWSFREILQRYRKDPTLGKVLEHGRVQLEKKLAVDRNQAGDEAEAVEVQVLDLLVRVDREELLLAAFRGDSEFRAQLDGFGALLRDFGGPGRHYAEVLLGGLWGLVCEYARSPEVLGQVTQAGLNNLDNLAREVADLRSTMAQQIAAAVRQELARRPKQIVEGRRPLQVSGFVDRPEFGRLRGVLDASDAVCILSGISGVGKSQLATAYAGECIDDRWQFVGWITATSRSEIIAQMAEIAWSHDLTDDADAGKAAARLVAWLAGSGPGPRLLVFDDVRAVDDLRAGDDAAGSLIPSGPGMRVLITTTRELNLSGEHVRVEEFTSDQAVEYLTRVSGDPDRDGAGEVAEALGFLPLALTQAGAYIDLYGYGYLDYLKELRGQSLDVSLEQPDGEPYPRLVGAALQLAFRAGLEQIQDRDSDAAAAAQQVLDVVSLLAESGVPRDWLYRVSDAEAANRKAVGLLLKTGVLAQSADHTVVSLHQLQSRVWRETLDTIQQETAVAATARVLSRVTIPQGADWETKARPTAQELASQLVFLSGRVGSESTAGEHAGLFWGVVSHPEVLAASINAMRWCVDAGLPGLAVDLAPYTRFCEQTLGTTHPDTLTSRNNLATAYRDAGKLDQAITLHKQTLADRERILGPRHRDTLASRSYLATAYRAAGKLDQAITLYEQTLADRERILGPRHRDTLASRNNLALAYKDAGNLNKAITLYEQTLTDQEQVLGPRHRDTLASRNNLALAYKDAGKLDQAITLYEQTLTDTEQVLGPRHPHTLTSRNNLAAAYQDAGNLDQAIPLFEQTLTDQEQILGPRHPHTLTSRNNLAAAYKDAGNLDQAITLFEQTLTDTEQVLGPRHPQTLASRNNLAAAYKDAGNLNKAITLHEQTLTDQEQILGPRHPHTLASRGNLATAYQDAGNLDQAITLHEQNLTDREQALGPRHPDTLTSRNNLATAYKDAGNLDQAIPLYEQNLTDQEQALGPRHPDTLTSRNNLAAAYQDAGNLDQAIPLYEQTLTDTEQVLGPRHPDTLTSRNNLATAYQDAGNLDQAITLHEQNLTDQEQALGPRHRDTLASRNNLALAYQDAGNLDQAITLFEQNLTDQEQVLEPRHPQTLASRNNLATAYRDAGDLDQAIPLFEQNLTDRERILGPAHPDTLTSRNNLATAYQDAGKLDQAIALYEQALSDAVEVLGDQHPTTLGIRRSLKQASRERDETA